MSVTTETPPKFGPKYGSKATAFQAIVRGKEPIIHPTSGKTVGHQKELIAEFAVHGGEYDIPTPDGGSMPFADIHGNFFNLDVQADEKGWTAEEKEAVRTRLDYLCRVMPEQVWHLEDAKLAPPVPTYDDLHHNTIPDLAVTLGLVAEFLAYEQQEKNRPSVVSKLEEALARQRQEAEDAEALTA